MAQGCQGFCCITSKKNLIRRAKKGSCAYCRQKPMVNHFPQLRSSMDFASGSGTIFSRGIVFNCEHYAQDPSKHDKLYTFLCGCCKEISMLLKIHSKPAPKEKESAHMRLQESVKQRYEIQSIVNRSLLSSMQSSYQSSFCVFIPTLATIWRQYFGQRR